MTITDDGQRAANYLPPISHDAEANRIKGSDGEWYDVPEPVLLRYMAARGLSTQRGAPPKLVRTAFGEVENVKAIPDANASLLLTDALLSQVTAYMEEGDIVELVDLIELIYELADRRGIGRNVVMAAVSEARLKYGGFDGVLMPGA